MSTQNRFVKQNYVEKINQLRKQQRVQAPSHIIAKGTLEGTQISWRNEEPAVSSFVVCRNGEEIDTLASDVNCYQDKFHGAASYTVYVVDIEGHKALWEYLPIVWPGVLTGKLRLLWINSPLTSIMEGTPLHIRFSVVENRLPEFVSGIFHYRRTGEKVWKKIPFKHRTRGVSTLTFTCF